MVISLSARVGTLAFGVAASVALFGGLGVSVSQAQQKTIAKPAEPRRVVMASRVFQVPLHLERTATSKLRDVCLFIKEGNGAWQFLTRVEPNAPFITCELQRDGEYAINIVTVDHQGKAFPSDLNKVAPAMVVVVNTQASPTDTAIAAGAAGQAPNGSPDGLVTVSAAPTPPTAPPPLTAPPVQAQPVQAQQVQAQPMPTQSAAAQAVQPVSALEAPAPANNDPAPAVPGSVALEVAAAAEPVNTPEGAFLPPGNPPPGLEAPGPLASETAPLTPMAAPSAPGHETKAHAASGNLPKRQYLNSTRVGLDYAINKAGPSGVSKIDVYVTSEQGGGWRRLTSISNPNNHGEIDLPGEGVFGIRLVAFNGNGFGAKVPAPADLPSALFEVDLTDPVLKVDIDPVTKNGTIDIRWKINDKNLGPEPIQIYYSTQPGSPWQPVTGKLKNDGRYRWALPRDIPARVLIRVEARDLAGNVSHVDSPNPILVDLTEPDISLVGAVPVVRPNPAR